jgi:predicted membrane protein
MDVDASAVSPSGTPLPWLVPDKGPLHLAIVVTLALTALLIYSLRAFTRGKLLRSFAIDDGLMVLAAVCSEHWIEKVLYQLMRKTAMHNRNFHYIHWSCRAWYWAAGRRLCLIGRQDCSDGPVDVGVELTHYSWAWCCQAISYFYSVTSGQCQKSLIHTDGTLYPSRRTHA